MPTMYEELMTAAGPKFGPKGSVADETDSMFFERLVRAIAKAPEERWNKLSLPGQQWVNDNILRIRSKEPLIPLSADVLPASKEVTTPPITPAPIPSAKSAPKPAEVKKVEPAPKPAEAKKVESTPKTAEDKKPAKVETPMTSDSSPAPVSQEIAGDKKAPAEPVTLKGPSVTLTFKRFVILHSKMKFPELVAAFRAQNPDRAISDSTAQAFYYDTVKTLALLEDLGMLKQA